MGTWGGGEEKGKRLGGKFQKFYYIRALVRQTERNCKGEMLGQVDGPLDFP